MKRHPPEVKEKTLRLYAEGASLEEIAEAGCPVRQLYRWVHAAGMPLRGHNGNPGKRRPRHPAEVVARAAELYAAGKSAEDVSESLGIARATVYHYVRASGQPVRSQARPSLAIADEVVIATYRELRNIMHTAKRLGISDYAVRSRLARAGVRAYLRPGRPRKTLTDAPNVTTKEGEED